MSKYRYSVQFDCGRFDTEKSCYFIVENATGRRIKNGSKTAWYPSQRKADIALQRMVSGYSRPEELGK